MADGICKHCKHRKTKKLNGNVVSDRCEKEFYAFFNPVCFPDCVKCDKFERSWKSRLGLVK